MSVTFWQAPRRWRWTSRDAPDPFKLREFAELTKDVVLVGAAGHIEIWSQERWDALEEEAEESHGGYRRAHGRHPGL